MSTSASMCFHFYINRLHYLPCKKGNTDAQNVSFWNTWKWPNYLVVINAMCFVGAMESLFSFDFMILEELNNVCAKYQLKNYMGNRERCFFVLLWAWDKGVPMRNQTSELWILHSDALPLSNRDSIVSEAHYEVHIWHASCILQGSAMLIVSCLYIE